MTQARARGTIAHCLMCGKEFVRRNPGALNCRRKCSQDYSNYRAGYRTGRPSAVAKAPPAIVAMERAWHYALSEMPPPCDS